MEIAGGSEVKFQPLNKHTSNWGGTACQHREAKKPDFTSKQIPVNNVMEMIEGR